MISTLKEIYAYRDMIITLVHRELRGRYKKSFLGYLWTLVNPLMQLAVYTVVFSFILRSGIENYYLFLFVALIPWIFFSTSVLGGANAVLSQKDIVKKIYFPRQVLPIAHVTTSFINMLLSFVVVLLVTAFSIGVKLNLVLFLIPIMLIEYFLALGLAFLTSAVTVYFRDLEHILGIVMMAWQFLTPIMYSAEMVPKVMKPIFYANPMTSIIIAYRDILYFKQIPNFKTTLLGFAIAIVILIIGWLVFDRLQRCFAEEF